VPIIKEELNVKEVKFENDLSEFMNYEVKPNFKLCGKIFGSRMKDFQNALTALNEEDIQKLENNEEIFVTVGDQKETVTLEMVEIRATSKEGYASSTENNQVIVLNTTVTEDLKQEGYAREIISKVQNMRKEKDFCITDRITIFYDGDEEIKRVMENCKEMISKETLANEIVLTEHQDQEIEINDKKIYLDVEKRG